MQAGADSGFDWLHWPRYVATGAQESMHAVLARQPAEVVHTARHQDVCAQQEKRLHENQHTRLEKSQSKPPQPTSRCNALAVAEPKVLSWVMGQADEMRKIDHANSIRTCQQCSQGRQALGHGNGSSVETHCSDVSHDKHTHASPFGTCLTCLASLSADWRDGIEHAGRAVAIDT